MCVMPQNRIHYGLRGAYSSMADLELWKKTLKEGCLKPHHLTAMHSKDPCDLKDLKLQDFYSGPEEPALMYLLRHDVYESVLWFLETYGITPNTNAQSLLEIHLGRRKEARTARLAVQWESMMQTLLAKTPSLPADSPYLLRLAMEACYNEPYIVAQIIAKGVDPDIAAFDRMDALAFLRYSAEHGQAWARVKELEKMLVASMVSQRRGRNRKAADQVFKDVSAVCLTSVVLWWSIVSSLAANCAEFCSLVHHRGI
jgi:hypothetical protein